MNCREVHRILTADTELAESAPVRKHLEACQGCRDLHRDLLSLEQLSGELRGRTKAPAFFTERVCSRVSGRSRATYWSLAATAAGLVFLAVGVVNLAGLSTEREGEADSRSAYGGERAQRILLEGSEASAVQQAQPDISYLGEEDWGSQETDRSTSGSLNGVLPVRPRSSSFGYVLEFPATIEVRQTQAGSDLYLEKVSH